MSAKSVSALRAKMIEDLQLAGLSERTQQAYVRSVRKLAQHYRQSPETLSEQQLRDYFLFLKNDQRFAPATLKMAYYGIRFFYTHTAPRQWETLAKLRTGAVHPRCAPPIWRVLFGEGCCRIGVSAAPELTPLRYRCGRNRLLPAPARRANCPATRTPP